MPRNFPATVRTVKPQIPNVVTIRFDARLKFQPGESIAVAFPGDPKKRYFSISSSPAEGPFVEITVKTDPGTPMEKAIASLKRGDSLELEGPFPSAISLPEPVSSSLVFIAAGTGVTPFRSMIHALIDHAPTKPFYLIHSVKSKAELLFVTDFREWSGAHKMFHYIPTITQDFDDNWENETGRIQENILRKHIPDKPNIYFLCGPNTFVDDMAKMLLDQLKVDPERIRREKW